MNQGFVKLWRDVWEDPRMRSPAHLSVYIWLLTHAQHGMIRVQNEKWRRARGDEARQVIFKGSKISLSPGQLTCGSIQISRDTGVPESTVRRILRVMESEHLIERQVSSHCSLVTILSWEAEQITERPDDQQMSTQQTATDQEIVTNKEWKNDKKEMNDKNIEIDAAQHGNADINEIISSIETTFGLPMLDGSKKDNRYAAHRLIQKMKKACGGDHLKAMESISAAIFVAKKDPFWGAGGKMTSVMALEKHIVSILHKASSVAPITKI